jgi:hypothetical protein
MTHFRITPLNRPVTNYGQVDYSSEAYKQAERQSITRREAEKAEFRKTWTQPPPSPDDEDSFEAWAIEEAAFEIWKLRRQGRVATATAPYWHDYVDDWLMGTCTRMDHSDGGLLSREPTAASVTLPFIMQGGEFSVTFTTEQYRGLSKSDGDTVHTSLKSAKRLRIGSDHGIYHGELIADHGCEMSYEIVSLPAGTPQDVADRVAKAWRAIIDVELPKDYATVMPLSGRCGVCHRPLADQISKTLGIGPDCARRLGVPHNAETASTIITKRHKFLAELS